MNQDVLVQLLETGCAFGSEVSALLRRTDVHDLNGPVGFLNSQPANLTTPLDWANAHPGPETSHRIPDYVQIGISRINAGRSPQIFSEAQWNMKTRGPRPRQFEVSVRTGLFARFGLATARFELGVPNLYGFTVRAFPTGEKTADQAAALEIAHVVDRSVCRLSYDPVLDED